MSEPARGDNGHTSEISLLDESAEDLYDHAPCGYLTALPDGEIAKVNRTLSTWLGYRKDELVGVLRFQDLLALQGRPFYENHYHPLLLLQDSVGETAFDLVDRGGRALPVLLSSVLVRDRDGQPRFHRMTILDVTRRRACERELHVARRQAERAARAKAGYLTMLGHDIRDPLLSIQRAAAELDGRGAAFEAERVRTIRTEADRLLRVLEEILVFGRLDAGRMRLHPRRFDLRQLVEEVAAAARIAAEEKRLTLSVHVDDRVPSGLVGDCTELGRVLTHLLRNATGYTHQGSVILAVELVGPLADMATVEVRVSDTGIGIHRQRLREIFEDFANAPPAIPGPHAGSGIGLATCRKILELFGTEMKVESTPGKGSTFSFCVSLPVALAGETEPT